MIFKNMSNDQIKQQLDVRGYRYTERSVATLISEVKKEIRSTRTADIADKIDIEIAILENIRNLAYESFERSCQDAESEETFEESHPIVPASDAEDVRDENARRQQAADAINALTGVTGFQQIKRTIKTKRVGQTGDPRFLDTMLKTSAEIRKLYGIEPGEVKRVELNITDSRFDPSELRGKTAAELAGLITEALQSSPET